VGGGGAGGGGAGGSGGGGGERGGEPGGGQELKIWGRGRGPGGLAVRGMGGGWGGGGGEGEGGGALQREWEDDGITSENGASVATLLSPPVFHLRRLSCTLPSHGFRNRPHGSQADRGITVTSEEFLVRILRPVPATQCLNEPYDFAAFSKPAPLAAGRRDCESSGLAAIKQVASQAPECAGPFRQRM